MRSGHGTLLPLTSLALSPVWELLVFPVSFDCTVLLPRSFVGNAFFQSILFLSFSALRASLFPLWYSLLSLILFFLLPSSFSFTHFWGDWPLPPQSITTNFFLLIFYVNEPSVLPSSHDFILLPYQDKFQAFTVFPPLCFGFHCGSHRTVQ